MFAFEIPSPSDPIAVVQSLQETAKSTIAETLVDKDQALVDTVVICF
jgi:hypothetical protein